MPLLLSNKPNVKKRNVPPHRPCANASRRSKSGCLGYWRPSQSASSAKGSHWPRCKLHSVAAGAEIVTLASLELHFVSWVLRDNGDGLMMLAFALCGIQPNKPINAFRAVSLARSKPRWILSRSATPGTANGSPAGSGL
jgi:hypothetical protein